MSTTAEDGTSCRLRQQLYALDEDFVTRMDEASVPVEIRSGQTIICEGEPATRIFSLAQGMACVFRLMADGRRQVTGFLYPGDFLGVTFNLDPVYGYSAEALTVCSLRAWPRKTLEKLIDETPGARRLFLVRIGDELTEAQDRMLLLGRRTIEEKVATFLLTMARRQAKATGIGAEVVEIPMRWADIADYLGSTAETVSRTLSSFRDRDIIRTGKRGKIGITDWNALETIALGAKVRPGEICR
jgi:CRP/FNR family transcriptional regulator